MEDLVSVIMPAYNAEKFIGFSIQSILNQSYKNWELIICNDCSTDETVQIVQEFITQDNRIKLINLDKNNGFPAVPRNTSIKSALGKWSAMCDADDVWHPQKLELQINLLNQTGAQFCSSKMYNFTHNEEIIFEKPKNIKHSIVTFSKQLRRIRTPTSSVVLKTELLRKHPFKTAEMYKAREDFELWLRIHEHIGSSIKIDFPLMYYRVYEGQISGSKITMFKRTLKVLKEYKRRSGKPLGWKAYIYTFTHFLYAFYYRFVMKSM